MLLSEKFKSLADAERYCKRFNYYIDSGSTGELNIWSQDENGVGKDIVTEIDYLYDEWHDKYYSKEIEVEELPLFKVIREAAGLTDSDLEIIKSEAIKYKDTADKVKGLNSARKLRIVLPWNNKGKSGGGRVIFVNIISADKIYLVYLITKSEQEDLTPEEFKRVKKVVNALTDKFKK